MPLTGWVTQTIFIDCLKPNSTSSQEPKDETKENNQQCPKYLLSGSEDGTIKLWDLHDMGKKITIGRIAGLLDCSSRTIHRNMCTQLKREKELLNKQL